LAFINASGVTRLWPYLSLGAVLWFLVLESGIHATIAGVLLAATLPVRAGDGEETSPVHRLEHLLAPWVAFLVLPAFGFANAGVPLAVPAATLVSPVTIGVALGLFLGKQLGVFGGAWLAIRLRLAELPEGTTWPQLYGGAVLCGIGFTMSLFIGLLAFTDVELHDETKIGVLAGSLASAIGGWAVLRFAGEGTRRTA
jgi:NhaA family Na+:H+ antiporter